MFIAELFCSGEAEFHHLLAESLPTYAFVEVHFLQLTRGGLATDERTYPAAAIDLIISISDDKEFGFFVVISLIHMIDFWVCNREAFSDAGIRGHYGFYDCCDLQIIIGFDWPDDHDSVISSC